MVASSDQAHEALLDSALQYVDVQVTLRIIETCPSSLPDFPEQSLQSSQLPLNCCSELSWAAA